MSQNPPGFYGRVLKLWDYLDTAKLEEYITNGLVNCNFHRDDQDLFILTYGRSAMYENVWDDVTSKCRGLIVSMATGEIVARPFEKFHNLNTSDRPETHFGNLPQDEHPLVLEKLDGSLGILYSSAGAVAIASKGSFHSEHANWASRWYDAHVAANGMFWPQGWTPVFEMICETVQHHVVHYGWEGLVLLAMIDIETGEEKPFRELQSWAAVNNLRCVKLIDCAIEDAVEDDEPNEEGYVLTWQRSKSTPIRVKVKFQTFLRMQRIVHDATPRRIFETLAVGDLESLEQWANNGPAELGRFVTEWMGKLTSEYYHIFDAVKQLVTEALRTTTTRKEAALMFTTPENRQYAPACFLMLDQRDYGSAIWKLVEPMVKGQAAFYTEEEPSGDSPIETQTSQTQ